MAARCWVHTDALNGSPGLVGTRNCGPLAGPHATPMQSNDEGDAHIVGYGQTQPGSTDTVESGRLDTTLAARKYLFALDQACAEK